MTISVGAKWANLAHAGMNKKYNSGLVVLFVNTEQPTTISPRRSTPPPSPALRHSNKHQCWSYFKNKWRIVSSRPPMRGYHDRFRLIQCDDSVSWWMCGTCFQRKSHGFPVNLMISTFQYGIYQTWLKKFRKQPHTVLFLIHPKPPNEPDAQPEGVSLQGWGITLHHFSYLINWLTRTCRVALLPVNHNM